MNKDMPKGPILIKSELEVIELERFKECWKDKFVRFLPNYKSEVNKFLADSEFGIEHSFKVLKKAKELLAKVEAAQEEDLNIDIIEQISVFHDIGKFFQELHSMENIKIATSIYSEYAEAAGVPKNIFESVIDGIEGSDFSNIRLTPSEHPPHTIEGELVQAADKMQDNLVSKVDRYYDYGVNKRGAIYFDPDLSYEQRSTFSFKNFSGDQLNVILAILGRRPEDFKNPVIQDEYRRWSIPVKERVEERILELSREAGESDENIEKIKKTIRWYRETFKC